MPRRFIYFQGQKALPIVLFVGDSDWLTSINDGYPGEALAFCRAILAASAIKDKTIYSMPPDDSRILRPLTETQIFLDAMASEEMSIVYADLETVQGYIVIPLLNTTATLTTAERSNISLQGRSHGAFLIGEHSVWGGPAALNNELISIFKPAWQTSTAAGGEPLISTGRYGTPAGEIGQILSPGVDDTLGIGRFISGPSVMGPETLGLVAVDGQSFPAIVDLNFDRIAP